MSEAYVHLEATFYRDIESFGLILLEELEIIKGFIKRRKTISIDDGDETRIRIIKITTNPDEINVLIKFLGEQHSKTNNLIDLVLRHEYADPLNQRLEILTVSPNEDIAKTAYNILIDELRSYMSGEKDYNLDEIEDRIVELEKTNELSRTQVSF